MLLQVTVHRTPAAGRQPLMRFGGSRLEISIQRLGDVTARWLVKESHWLQNSRN
jgi:hypothetical protein